MKTLVLTLALVTAPSAAFAYCGGATPSFSQSCEEGVRVIRNMPQALPRISPTDAARLELQRDRLQLERTREANRTALARRKADQEDERLRQQDYLYRDANSPLRHRFGSGLGYSGFGYGGFTRGPIVGPNDFVGGFRGNVRPRPRPRIRH